jgi:hypothetical protein
LIAYSSYENISTDAITTQIAPLDVASGGGLTQAASSLVLTTPGFWVVTDQP